MPVNVMLWLRKGKDVKVEHQQYNAINKQYGSRAAVHVLGWSIIKHYMLFCLRFILVSCSSWFILLLS